jgi:hypothetical protein
MRIETMLLILILTFAVGYVLNKWDSGRFRGRRPGASRNNIGSGIGGRRT